MPDRVTGANQIGDDKWSSDVAGRGDHNQNRRWGAIPWDRGESRVNYTRLVQIVVIFPRGVVPRTRRLEGTIAQN
jgi:hypothetical protein